MCKVDETDMLVHSFNSNDSSLVKTEMVVRSFNSNDSSLVETDMVVRSFNSNDSSLVRQYTNLHDIVFTVSLISHKMLYKQMQSYYLKQCFNSIRSLLTILEASS